MPDMIERLLKEKAEIEEELRYIEQKKSKIIDPNNVSLDLEKEEDQKKKQLAKVISEIHWWEGNQPDPNALSSLTIGQLVQKTHVDRDEEKRLFGAMIAGRSEHRILLIEAESGMGKTVLVERLLETAEIAQLLTAKVDLKTQSLTFSGILGSLQAQLSQKARIPFGDYENQCRRLINDVGLSVGQSTILSGVVNKALNGLSDKDSILEQQVITDAFLGDLAAFHKISQRPIVLSFDPFNETNVNDSVKRWLIVQFFQQVQLHPWLICVVAGQHTPSAELANLCIYTQLKKLPAKHVKEYLRQLEVDGRDTIIKYFNDTWVKEQRDNIELLRASLEPMSKELLVEWLISMIMDKTGGKPDDVRDYALRLKHAKQGE